MVTRWDLSLSQLWLLTTGDPNFFIQDLHIPSLLNELVPGLYHHVSCTALPKDEPHIPIFVYTGSKHKSREKSWTTAAHKLSQKQSGTRPCTEADMLMGVFVCLYVQPVLRSKDCPCSLE